MLYSYCLGILQEKAKEMGYNLVLHGSMNRDCDLIAIPWVDNPEHHFALIRALDVIITGFEYIDPKGYNYSVLPGGRHSYVINLNRGGYNHKDEFIDDPQIYLDISVTPLNL